MNIIFSEALTQALGWMLLHSLWQAALITALFYAVRRARLSPQRTYLWAVGALGSIALAAVITFLLQYQPPAAPHPTTHSITTYSPLNLPAVSTASPALTSMQSLMQWVDQRTEWVVSLWLVGLLIFSTRFFGGWWYLQRLKRRGTQLLSPWQSRVEVLAQRLSIRQSVAFRVSTLASVPMVIGQWKPMILMPLSMMSNLPSEQIEAIIVHELAHVRRQDYLINLLQSLVEVLFFYHPAVWWLSSVVREEREKCCDDLAVLACDNSLVYAKALLYAQEAAYQQVPYALAFANKKQYLLHRIQRLLVPQRVQRHWSAKLLGLLVPLALLVGLVVHRSLAHQSPTPAALTAALLPSLDHFMNLTDTVPSDTASDAWRATPRTKKFVAPDDDEPLSGSASAASDTIPNDKEENSHFSMSFNISDDEDSAASFYMRILDDSVFNFSMAAPGSANTPAPPYPPQGFSLDINDSTPSFHFHWDGSTEEDLTDWSEELAESLADLNFDFSFEDSIGIEEFEQAQRELEEAQRELADAQRELAAQQRRLAQKSRRLQQRRGQGQSAEELQAAAQEMREQMRELIEDQSEEAQASLEEVQTALDEINELLEEQPEEGQESLKEAQVALRELLQAQRQAAEETRQEAAQRREELRREAEEMRQEAQARAEEIRRTREQESRVRRDRSQRAMERLEQTLLDDGLIKDSEKYRFKLTPSGLSVNGKKQSDQLHQKYQSLLSEKNSMGYQEGGSLSIKKSPGSLSIQQEN